MSKRENKEERIYIGIIDPKGDFCPVPYGTCNSLCDNCKGGMTRQEAITAIVKALKKEKIKCFVVKGYSISDNRCAEIAINALLGVEK